MTRRLNSIEANRVAVMRLVQQRGSMTGAEIREAAKGATSSKTAKSWAERGYLIEVGSERSTDLRSYAVAPAHRFADLDEAQPFEVSQEDRELVMLKLSRWQLTTEELADALDYDDVDLTAKLLERIAESADIHQRTDGRWETYERALRLLMRALRHDEAGCMSSKTACAHLGMDRSTFHRFRERACAEEWTCRVGDSSVTLGPRYAREKVKVLMGRNREGCVRDGVRLT
jgi:hypothetical protein